MKLKLEYVDPRLLQPNPWNTNAVSEENLAKIRESISQLGTFKPILARTLEDGSLQIIGGEHRSQVAIELGHETVPVIMLGEIDDMTAKKMGLADNGRYGTDDTIALAKLLGDLGTPEELEAILPYSNDQLESIFASTNISLDDLDIDESMIEKLGDGKDAGAAMPKSDPTHQTMKFRVRVEDANKVTSLIERVMKNNGFTTDTAEVNAGDALIWVCQNGVPT